MGNTLPTSINTHLNCGVSDLSIVQTKNGAIQLSKLIGSVVELWTDKGWISCKIINIGRQTGFNVELSNGAYLVCSKNTELPELIIRGSSSSPSHSPRPRSNSIDMDSPPKLLRGYTSQTESINSNSPKKTSNSQQRKVRGSTSDFDDIRRRRKLKTDWVAKSISQMKLGARLAPQPELRTNELNYSRVSPDDAFIEGKTHKIPLNEICGTKTTAGYSPGAIRAFLSGWASTDSVIIGTKEDINILRCLAFRANLYKITTSQHNNQYSMFMDKYECRGFKMPCKYFGKHIQMSHQSLVEVKKIHQVETMCAIIPTESTHCEISIYVNGLMVVFNANKINNYFRQRDENNYFPFSDHLIRSKGSDSLRAYTKECQTEDVVGVDVDCSPSKSVPRLSLHADELV